MNFTVLDVSPEVRKFPSQYGEMASYRLNLRNGDGTEHLNVELVRRALSPAPMPGAQLEGELEERDKHGLKLNLAYHGGGGGGSGSRPEDPLRQKRIVRQHSQNMAIELVRFAIEHKVMPLPVDSSELFMTIRKTADWFDADVERAAS